jgi:hypothetical protein
MNTCILQCTFIRQISEVTKLARDIKLQKSHWREWWLQTSLFTKFWWTFSRNTVIRNKSCIPLYACEMWECILVFVNPFLSFNSQNVTIFLVIVSYISCARYEVEIWMWLVDAESEWSSGKLFVKCDVFLSVTIPHLKTFEPQNSVTVFQVLVSGQVLWFTFWGTS